MESSKTKLELNALKSSSPLSLILDNVPLIGTRLIIPDATPDVEKKIRGFAYYFLEKFALKHFITFTIERVEKGAHLVLVSSDKEPVEDFVREIQMQHIHVVEKPMVDSETRELLRRYKHVLLENYIRLALRNYLQSIGCKRIRIGGRTWWSKRVDDSYLYVVDVDVDPAELTGYISVDIKVQSESLWDKITSGKIRVSDLQELLDSVVLVPFRRSFAYGRITGFINQKVSEDVETEHGKLNLYEYYRLKKNEKLNPNEHPIVKVKLNIPEFDGELYYPPSQVRLLIPERKLGPYIRYEEINKLLQKISSGFKPFGITFKRVSFDHRHYVDMITGVKLRYGGNRETYVSPLPAIQRHGINPLRGAVNIPLIILLLPDNFSKQRNDIEVFAKLLQRIYKSYNMGNIEKVEVEFYSEKRSIDEQKAEFARVLGNIVKEYSPKGALVCPVVNHRYLFKIAKQICSEKYFHARVIRVDTFTNLLDGIREFVVRECFNNIDSCIDEFATTVKNRVSSDKRIEQFVSVLSNIAFSLYVEFVIQSDVADRRVPRLLTWSLAEPADGEGRTLYLGFDVSRIPWNRSEVAAMFVLYDSYGNMINTVVKHHSGEKLSREFLEETLLSLIAHSIKPEHVNRLLVFKDGIIRGVDEAENISNALSSLGSKAGFSEYDVVGVVKRPNLRLFSISVSSTREPSRVENPERGTWIKLWSIARYGVVAERALVVSSKAKTGRTVRPVVIEHYSTISRSGNSIEKIVLEYMRLCRLNFWNPMDGLSKYPLPLLMADKIAHLSALGVSIRTP
ncbi:MAG: hypothetical protein QXQ91_03815 [Nanopusillaceae archaeon]